MLLNFGTEHKEHLMFLTKQSDQVLKDFCKLAADYLLKGPNPKVFASVAQKLQVEAQTVRNSVQGLLNLLLECCKTKFSGDEFNDSLLSLGFTQGHIVILEKLLKFHEQELKEALVSFDVELPSYYDMDWRFETQIASRSLMNQIVPQITLDLQLKDKEVNHVLLQTDPNNLMHLAQELETALREERSQHIRNLSKIVD